MDLNTLVIKLQNENFELRKKVDDFGKNKFLPLLDKDLTLTEKDECKVLISDYINKKSELIQAKNANQLLYIINFLIEYINSKEKVFKEKVNKQLIA